MFKDLKKFQAELDKYNDVNYASKMEIDCAKAKGDLMSYKIDFEKSSNAYTQKINDLNQTISDMKKELCAHQETISIMSQAKEAREDKELDKVIALENKVKFLKKARRSNPRLYDIGVIPTTSVSRPQLKSNQLEDRVMPNNSQGKKQNVEDHRRHFKFSNNKTSVTACNDSLNAKTSNVNFVCVTCGKCVLNDNHDLCVLHYINGVNSRTRQPMVVPISTREPKQNVNQSVATSSKKTVATDSTVKKFRNTTRKIYEQVSKTCSWWYPKYTPPGYNWKPKSEIGRLTQNLVEIILFIVDSGCSKHMTGNLKLLTNFVEKFLGTVKFGNDQIAPILGYGDLGNDLLTGSRGTDLYSISLQDSTTPNPICLMAKATSSQACSDPGHNVNKRYLNKDNLKSRSTKSRKCAQVAETVTTSNELELLYSPMFSELLNGNSHVVSKSSAVHAADNPDKRQQHNTTHTSTTTDVADPPPLNILNTSNSNSSPTGSAPEKHLFKQNPIRKCTI
ncbi:hypothetical protein Tco_0724342 [Tanacetum coccineum]